MWKSLLASLLRAFSATVVEKGSEALAAKLEHKDGTDFSEPPKVKPRRNLAQLYTDELERLNGMQSLNTAGMNENEVNRLKQSIVTQAARVAMYKARLEAQNPTV